MKVGFFNDDLEIGLALGPFAPVEETESETKVPIDFDTMDDEAERLFCEAQAVGVPLKNLLAVRQAGGAWELRELVGKWAYEVFENARIIKA